MLDPEEFARSVRPERPQPLKKKFQIGSKGSNVNYKFNEVRE